MKSCVVISESFNKNASSVCDCPKECDIVHYKATMSYATANQNQENEYDLSEKLLRTVGTHLNKSLDTRQYILHLERETNIDKVTRALLQQPPQNEEMWAEYHTFLDAITSSRDRNDRTDVIGFIGLALRNMQKVFERGFSDGWRRMNIYFDILPDLFMHTETLSASEDTIEQKQWRADLLKLQLIVSKLSLYHLDRVHNAYHRAVPLVNTCVTPNCRYDGLYLTKALLEHTHDINETFARLRGHITKSIEHIDGLFHPNITYGHMTETKNTSVDHNNAFWRTVADYERDLKQYESLVIKQPQERIVKVIEMTEIYRKDIVALDVANTEWKDSYRQSVDDLDRCLTAYHNTNTTAMLKSYFADLKNERQTSKLHLALKLHSNNAIPLLYNFRASIWRTQESMCAHIKNIDDLGRMHCKFYINTRNSLLQAFFSKLHYHLNITTGSEKSAMEDYFMLNNRTSHRARIVRGDETLYHECTNRSFLPSHSIKKVHVRNIYLFKVNLDKFLRTTDLNGKLFR